jgi:hypothetical protein
MFYNMTTITLHSIATIQSLPIFLQMHYRKSFFRMISILPKQKKY